MTNVSLVSGRVINTLVNEGSALENNASDDVAKSQSLKSTSKNSLNLVDSGSNFLSQRIWKGLEPHVGEDAVFAATTGQSGIAMNYNNEKKDYSEAT